MRGIALLLATICIANAFNPHRVAQEEVDFAALSRMLTFDLTYSEKLTPLVSLMCAPLDYIELSVIPGWHQHGVINQLQKSVCSKLPRDMRLDFSYLKDCLNDTECFKTNKMDFLVGLTDENVFFSHYNIERVPKAPIVSACLNEDSCSEKNEAEQLLGQWRDLIENCDKVEDKKEMREAMEGVSMVAAVSQDDSLASWYQETLSDCLILTPSVDIKRMMAEKLEPTAACSEQVRDKLLQYVEKDWNAPMDVAMTVTRQLMSCENETLALMVQDMLIKNDNQYQTGYAVWETMKMMADERYQLRKKRHVETSYERTLNDVVSNSHLQQKWNSAPFTWKYSYTLDETAWSSQTIYSAIITLDTSAENPLATVRLSEVSSYPPIETHVVVALESELMSVLNKFINGENVDITQVYRYVTEQGFFIPFKLSATILSDEFDYDSEGMRAFAQEISKQMETILGALLELPDLGRIAIEKVAGTEAGIQIFYETDEEGAHFNAVIKNIDGSSLAEISLKAKMSQSEGGPGFSISGKASMFSAEYHNYDIRAVFQPLTENLEDKTQCEMSVEIYEELTQKSLLSLSSCVRPVFMSAPSEPLSPLANVYRTLEIPDWLKLNLTLDFGKNGFIGFVSSPKSFVFNIHYMNNLVAEFAAKLELKMDERRSRKTKDEVQPMFRTVTSAEVKIPSLSDRTASFEMNSKMFEDFSAASIFHITSFLDVDGVAEVYDGVLDASSCSPGMEEMMTTLMFTGTLDKMPEKICYNIALELPNQMGTLTQDIEYDMQTTDLLYVYNLDMTSSYVKLGGLVQSTGDGKETLTCSVSLPVPVELQISNNLPFEFPDFSQKVTHFQYTSDGILLNMAPIDGILDRPFAVSFSAVDYTPVLESNSPENFAFCTFENESELFLGQFHCDLKCSEADKKMAISNDGEAYRVKSECSYGSVEANMDMEKVWGSVLDEDSKEMANLVLSFEEPELVVKAALEVSADSAKPMCTLIEYKGGEITQDILNRQCLNETLFSRNWDDLLPTEVSDAVEYLELDDPMEWSVDKMGDLFLALYESLIAKFMLYDD